MLGIDFNEEKNNGKLKKDEHFKGSFTEKLGFSEFICPECKAHLKDVDGDLICLNGCHMPKQWQDRFTKIVSEKR
jgi:hypothetical protein